jgi:hypothetical protein
MTDKELVELAAKAAGYVSQGYGELCGGSPFLYLQEADFTGMWAPLTDDGDALRLAVKLNLFNTRSKGYEWPDAELFARHDEGPYAATRRAIVRAAAEIGKAMP